MTASTPTAGQVARRAWQIRPSPAELLAITTVLAAVHGWLGWPLLPGALITAVVIVVIAIAVAVSELREEATQASRPAEPPEMHGGDDAAV
ncbi:hypothetical protein GCM10010156_64920 [Planobispora rosea]|uniref:Uncharacterized protein n=1 Tax=Planobispora rosea TaxID=35762 RepID=A0A8J3WF79_PLARO|nr:hypothetical protein [Planobispora rosea]GGS97741.1 hypothetical protein GCM10010156_64920 [Planobispora rosea]GIH87829.1 hypothetical protein Pro02_62370 [Planobispora rosea]